MTTLAEGQFANLPGQETSIYAKDENHPSVDLDEFHWTIIPKELGVGENTQPEKWVLQSGASPPC